MFHELVEQPERALIVGIDRQLDDWTLEDSLAELTRLVETAGAVVVGSASQRLQAPNARTFVGTGKAQEISTLAATLEADLIVFDDELTPSQQSNLEKIVQPCKVIDRTALILDIFALHATTHEGRLQVRLAQNQYLLPRLRGMWAHLASNRMGGGVGSRFGEGESQLEVDRRMVRKRITSIQRELKALASNRNLQRSSRAQSGIFRVALAGYTNAGKSSLLNRLTQSDVLVYDKLFATLDATTRKLVLPEGRQVTITDTVGFIHKLPTSLIEAFKSTLDEILQADLILHVTDASDPQRQAQMEAVLDVIQQIHAEKIPRLAVFNKIDLLTADEREALASRYSGTVFVSSLTGNGLENLIEHIGHAASADGAAMTVLIPYTQGNLVRMAHEHCDIASETFEEAGTLLTMLVPRAYQLRYLEYVVQEKEPSS